MSVLSKQGFWCRAALTALSGKLNTETSSWNYDTPKSDDQTPSAKVAEEAAEVADALTAEALKRGYVFEDEP